MSIIASTAIDGRGWPERSARTWPGIGKAAAPASSVHPAGCRRNGVVSGRTTAAYSAGAGYSGSGSAPRRRCRLFLGRGPRDPPPASAARTGARWRGSPARTAPYRDSGCPPASRFLKSWPLATICVPTRISTPRRRCTVSGKASWCAALLAGAVGIDAQDARFAGTAACMLFHTLRAAPCGCRSMLPQVGAVARHAHLQAAVVAAQAVVRRQCSTIKAVQRLQFADPAAGFAVDHRRIAAPVQEQQGLLARAPCRRRDRLEQ